MNVPPTTRMMMNYNNNCTDNNNAVVPSTTDTASASSCTSCCTSNRRRCCTCRCYDAISGRRKRRNSYDGTSSISRRRKKILTMGVLTLLRSCFTRYGLQILLGINLFTMIFLHRIGRFHLLQQDMYHHEDGPRLTKDDISSFLFTGKTTTTTRTTIQPSSSLFETENNTSTNNNANAILITNQQQDGSSTSQSITLNKKERQKQRVVEFATLLQKRLLVDDNSGHDTVSNETMMDSSLASSLSTIYRDNGSWDNSPIVIEEYKLLFFTQAKIACTVFKQLLRRMMHYDHDWFLHKEPYIPHNPRKNGLQYLYDYNPTDAVEMLTSKEWIRAIFVRDPVERFLSAYLDKAKRKNGIYVYKHCCGGTTPNSGWCPGINVSESIDNFFKMVSTDCCCDPHWKSQSSRLGSEFESASNPSSSSSLWNYINFIGSFDTLGYDTKRLLDKLDENLRKNYEDSDRNRTMPLWDMYGASGWGKYRNVSIFDTTGTEAKHKTNSIHHYDMYFSASASGKSNSSSTNMEDLVKEFYRNDYDHPLFNFTKK